MKFETTRFGAVEYDDAKAFLFPEGLPGMEELRRFVLINSEETEPILWMQSLEEPSLSLPVAPLFELLPDYELDVDDDDLALLKIKNHEDVLVLTVLVIQDELTKMTANLAAPVLVHTREGLAKQVFNKASYPVRQPIFEAVIAALERRESHAGAVTQGE